MKSENIREVTVNYNNKKVESFSITSAEQVANRVRELLPDNSREHFMALYLDGAHQIIGYSIVHTGTANSCTVHMREVYQRAILLGATALIIAHNHPSGKIDPSPSDDAVTKKAKEAGELLGVKLLDHVIVTEYKAYSYQETGRLNKY